MIPIAITSASLPTKKRILTVCVKLFLEKGYKQTTLAEINEKAGVSFSQFQNIFRAKDGVLTELSNWTNRGRFTEDVKWLLFFCVFYCSFAGIFKCL